MTRQQFRLTQAQLGKVMGVAIRTIHVWEAKPPTLCPICNV